MALSPSSAAASSNNNSVNHNHNKKTKSMPSSSSLASDAAFLERQCRDGGGGGAVVATAAAATASAGAAAPDEEAVAELHRSNLLGLQCQELLQECSAGQDKWVQSAVQYVKNVQQLVQECAIATTKAKANDNDRQNPFPRFSDQKISPTSISNGAIDGLTASPTGCSVDMLHYHHHYHPATTTTAAPVAAASGNVETSAAQLGLTSASGNANVLPTFDVVVRIPNTAFVAVAGEETSSSSSSKRHARHRYYDTRNEVVWAVARYLSHKRFRSTVVGRVYVQYRCNDERKPVLLLVPPTRDEQEEQQQHEKKGGNNGQKKKRKKEKGRIDDRESTAAATGTVRMPKRVRFRVRLLFEMESVDWIPPLRLLPNRSNLRQQAATPYYNFCLVEDANHEFVDPLLSCHSRRRSRHHRHHGGGDHDDESDEGDNYDDQGDVAIPATKTFQDALILAKIWALQRGLLRGHDAYQIEHLALLLVYLFRTKQANARMTPLQVLAALFKLVSQSNWLGDSGETNMKDNKEIHDAENKNLIRKASSEAYQGATSADNTASAKKRRTRTVLVMPRLGRTEKQTVAASKLAQLYAQQTRESPVSPDDPPTLVELYQQQDPQQVAAVFLDPTMTYNFFGRLSLSFVRTAQREAAKCLHCLHSVQVDRPFPYLFMTQARFWSRYDAYLRIPLSKVRMNSSSSSKGLWNNIDIRRDIGDYECAARGIVDVLRRALGDRVNDIRILTTGNGVVGGVDEQADAASHPSVQDSDEIQSFEVGGSKRFVSTKLQSPTGSDHLVVGVTFRSDTCFRVVDRGPPADDTGATEAFRGLWGSKAQLRRFKDGAIVYAVVWEATSDDEANSQYVQFQNDDKLQGGIVERIIKHILRLHFLEDEVEDGSSALQFSLRNMVSVVDGVLPRQRGLNSNDDDAGFNPLTAHRMAIKAFNTLSDFLRQNSAATISVPGSSELTSRLGLPLAIDAVEPLSPALRYAELFPPLPHPWLGSQVSTKSVDSKAAGAVLSDPIEIQIRFGPSSKWPTDMKAMGAAKTAMLISLVDGIEAMKRDGGIDGSDNFYGHSYVTPSHADIGFMGYVFRIRVRADPELRLLQSLSKPNAEALSLLHVLTRRHVVSSMHHSMVHSVYSRYPSSSAVSRMARRWLSSHLLSGHIPFEAVELLVASVYSNRISPLDAPGSVVAGFLRFLELLGTHDWAREPLIVDPNDSLSSDDKKDINEEFELVRGSNFRNGPPMYVISPNDAKDAINSKPTSRRWMTSFTTSYPEAVVFARAIKLANRSYSFLRKALVNFQMDAWPAAFLESKTSFSSYSALLRIDQEFLLDSSSSSTADANDFSLSKSDKSSSAMPESVFTRGMRNRYRGPKVLQKKWYKNILSENSDSAKVILEWKPVNSIVQRLRSHFGSYFIVFYNDLCPNVLALLWRPSVFATSRPFSALVSAYVAPVTADGWQHDTLVAVNVGDILREISVFTKDVVIDVKVFDAGVRPSIVANKKRKLADNGERSGAKDVGGNDSDDESESTTGSSEEE